MPDTCCKIRQENCGNGQLNLPKSDAIKIIHHEGCFTLFEQKIDAHILEGSLVVSIVCLCLLILAIFSLKVTYIMSEKYRNEKREEVFQFKMYNRFDFQQ